METRKIIILASASPRRQELLRNLGLPFIVRPSHADEHVDDGRKPAEVVELLAERKAAEVAGLYEEGLIIGSDTIVVLDGEILGKPGGEDEAYAMLSKLSGREHSVFSGLAVIDALSGEKRIGYMETKVKMRPITEKEINDYIKTKEPMDKAGSYAIQGLGSLFITGIQGDYFSVVGLPIRLLAEYLQGFGVDILGEKVKQTFVEHTQRN
ncbi:MAG TPA: Maf family protein [Bacillota bacterium]|nr:Maf family protein [Bacillota bacterium]